VPGMTNYHNTTLIHPNLTLLCKILAWGKWPYLENPMLLKLVVSIFIQFVNHALSSPFE
jgi:hypothetical protein